MNIGRFKKQGQGFLILLLTITMVFEICRLSYRSYNKELILKEQEQLLMMARTIGKGLTNYVEQELDSIELYFEVQDYAEARGETQTEAPTGSVRYLIDHLADRQPELYESARCYDSEGNLVYARGKMEPVELPLVRPEHVRICGKKLAGGDHYQMIVARGFRFGGKIYTAVYALSLNEIYKQIVAPVRIGLGGYSVVKDEDLTILMHHAPSQIGMDALYDRNLKYPDLDLTDLEDWIHLQENQREGAAVIRSYKWDQPELTPEKRIVAYTTIRLPGETWIVNSTLPYKELDIPLQQMIVRLAGTGGALLVFLLILEFAMIRGVMRAQSQKKEITYLKEINAGMELLRKKEEEIRHYQRVQSIGEMSSHIAHEFNNYLTPIMVYGELLETDPEITLSQKEMVTEILGVAEQAAGLSRRLLDFSRQDSSIVMEPVNLTEEMRKACRVVSPLTPSRVRFLAELPETPSMIVGQKGMMEHILMNLCNNAFHAMEKNTDRECVLKVSLLQELSGTAAEEFPGHVCVQVSDTGCGIREEAMNHIFEPFYTTKRSGKGTGLGLSVVQNLVTACKGAIRIDSHLEEGTTFSLYFPLCSEQPEEAAETKAEPVRAHRSLKKKVRVLVIDDDPQVLKAMEARLKREAVPAAFYSHPAAALSRIQNETDFCEILLTDYDMPSMNGVELAEIVRKLNPRIRIILMSGMDENQFAWYLKNRFIDAFVPKQELAQRIPEICGE